MSKKMPHIEAQECSECGNLFIPSSINEVLCSRCCEKIRKAQKKAGKTQKITDKKRWYENHS